MHRKDRLNDVLAIAALFVLTAALRLNLLGAPLERDEGEYAYAAQLIMNGMHPSVHLHSLKLQGVFWAYVGIMKIFGETAYGIHLGLLLISFFTSWIIHLTACRFFGLAGGLAAAAAFAVLTIGQPVMGVFTHSEHFVVAAAGFFPTIRCARV